MIFQQHKFQLSNSLKFKMKKITNQNQFCQIKCKFEHATTVRMMTTENVYTIRKQQKQFEFSHNGSILVFPILWEKQSLVEVGSFVCFSFGVWNLKSSSDTLILLDSWFHVVVWAFFIRLFHCSSYSSSRDEMVMMRKSILTGGDLLIGVQYPHYPNACIYLLLPTT